MVVGDFRRRHDPSDLWVLRDADTMTSTSVLRRSASKRFDCGAMSTDREASSPNAPACQKQAGTFGSTFPNALSSAVHQPDSEWRFAGPSFARARKPMPPKGPVRKLWREIEGSGDRAGERS